MTQIKSSFGMAMGFHTTTISEGRRAVQEHCRWRSEGEQGRGPPPYPPFTYGFELLFTSDGESPSTSDGEPLITCACRSSKKSGPLMVLSTIVSERGTASVLMQKPDSDFYTTARPRGNNKKDTNKASSIESNTERDTDKGSGSLELKASGSSSERSSSQDLSSKRAKFKKVTYEDLYQLSEKRKKENAELMKEKRRQQWQQHQQQVQQQPQPTTMESRLKEFLGSFVKQGTVGVFYKKKVKFMRDLGYFKLAVDFNDIM